ncbi:hypothetical protein SAMN05880582_11319 [Rhizobium sp. RU20A]|uniref:hypothetical protein n=1 Tax=Rhizobium sp. RU20A TaxID=1907412 RepID=UPI0009551E86|nr:hypothetical protein [Rhizobium sp. RU20A]SIR42455.1 hypothetical protein SAMN05880582_11319 [Rhizobium sp. RU20A]
MHQKPAVTGAAGSVHLDRRAERIEMRQLFLISYPLCLMAALARRATAFASGKAASSDQSVFAEARSSAYAAVGYAFHA